jgi:predicted PurR-regulated permease PerM
MVDESDRIKQVAVIVVLALLVIGCFVVLRPFLAAILWGLIICLSTWPAYQWLQHRLGDQPGLAATLMTLLLAAAFLVPLVIVGAGLAENATSLFERVTLALKEGPPDPPAWLNGLPLVGPSLQAFWVELTQGGEGVVAKLMSYAGPVKDWLLTVGTSLGQGILELSLSVITAFFIYRDGAAGVQQLKTVLVRLTGDRAQPLLDVVGGTMKGVIYGIIGSALAQGILAGFGFWLAGVPGALFLGVVTAFLSVLPGGPLLLWGPAAVWLFYKGAMWWGIFIVVWGLFVVGGVDNLIKPYFISRGSDLPLILIFLGVLGGVLAFGFLGVFLGPTLLAVGYTLLREWTQTDSIPAALGNKLQ